MLERKIGDIVITRVIESERPDFDAGQFFPSITPEQWAPYRQRLAGWAMDLASNGLVFPMQSFLVRTAHHTIVVDTCVGDHKKRVRPNWNMTSGGEFLKRFAETGVRPEQVEIVGVIRNERVAAPGVPTPPLFMCHCLKFRTMG